MFGVWENKSERATSRRASSEPNTPFKTSQPTKGKGSKIKTWSVENLRRRSRTGGQDVPKGGIE